MPSHPLPERPGVDQVPGAPVRQPLDEVALVPGRLTEVTALVVQDECMSRVQLRGADELALGDRPRHGAAVELLHAAGRPGAQPDGVPEPVALAPRAPPAAAVTLPCETRGEAARPST